MDLAHSAGYLYVSWKSMADSECHVSRFSATGTLNWTANLSIPTAALPRRLSTDMDANVYVAGDSHESIESGQNAHGGSDLFLIKINSTGSVMWKSSFGFSSNDFVRGMDTDGSKAVYVVGYTGSDAGPKPSTAVDFIKKIFTTWVSI